MSRTYGARRIRATKAGMVERKRRLVELAYEHGPCSVRHMFYLAVVESMPGITKNDSGYDKVQRAVLDLRRSGEIPYRLIVDSTRWRSQQPSWDGLSSFLEDQAALYRRDMWSRSDYGIEVWAESASIAGTLAATVNKWGLGLFVTRGQSSETFAFESANEWRHFDKQRVVLYVGDHDPHGLEIERSLREKLIRFSSDQPEWVKLGVTWDQVEAFDLPGTKPKKSYGFPQAVEAEALPPRELIRILDETVAGYSDPHELKVIQSVERQERSILKMLAQEHSE